MLGTAGESGPRGDGGRGLLGPDACYCGQTDHPGTGLPTLGAAVWVNGRNRAGCRAYLPLAVTVLVLLRG